MNISERFKHTHLTLHLCNQALSEMRILAKPRKSKSELQIVQTLKFYNATLQYCFNAEYTKLLESKPNKRFPDNHSGSLILLNQYLLDEYGNNFKSSYDKNELLFQEVLYTPFYEKTIALRDKKFSHKDLDDPTPNSIVALTHEEIETGLEHLRIMYQILNNCAINFSVKDSVPDDDTRTDNFIRYNAVYSEYYRKHSMDAFNEGYRLND